MDVQGLLTPVGSRGGVIFMVNPVISGVFLKTRPSTPLGVASLNLKFLNLGVAFFQFSRSLFHIWDHFFIFPQLP